jgi:hypothetical protein
MQVVTWRAVIAATNAPLPGASVSVYLTGTTTRAALYSATGAAISNPTTADANGSAVFAAPNGTYDIQVSSGAYVGPLIGAVQIYDQSAFPTAGSLILQPTWNALAGLTGGFVGEAAEVPASDTGTHTDPVTSATGVANSGRYAWATSPHVGWQWVSALNSAASVQTALTAALANETARAEGVETGLANTITGLLSSASIGQNLGQFTTTLPGANGSGAPLSPLNALATPYGQAWRVVGANTIAQRALQWIEPGRVYDARWVYRRYLNPSDPAGDDVRAAVQWFDQNYAPMSQSVVSDLTATTALGLILVECQIPSQAGASPVVVPPSGAVYFRLFSQSYGSDGVTDFIGMGEGDTTVALRTAQSAGAGASGGPNYQLVSTNFAAVAGTIYLVNTTAGALTTSLPPNPTMLQWVTFFDAFGTWAANPLLIQNNGNPINGVLDNDSADVTGLDITYVFVGGSNGWIHKLGAAGQPRPFSTDIVDAGATGVALVQAATVPQVLAELGLTPGINLLLYSENVSNPVWSYTNAQGLLNVITGPTNLMTGCKLIETATTGLHFDVQSIYNQGLGATITFSRFLAQGERAFATLDILDTAGESRAIFNLANGTGTAATGTVYSIVLVTAGWYRCSVTRTLQAPGGVSLRTFVTPDNSGNYSYAGTYGYGIYTFGAQVNPGAVATPYVMTQGVAINQLGYAGLNGYNQVIQDPASLSDGTQFQNICLCSQEFTLSPWSTSNATVTAGAATAPDNTSTAAHLAETATTAVHAISQPSSGVSSGQTVVFSLYVKAAERWQVFLQLCTAGTTVAYQIFDLLAGTFTGVAYSGTSITGMTQLPNGWWRIWMSITTTASTTLTPVITIGAGNGGNYGGTAGSGLYIWGAQIEPGTTPSRYRRAYDAALICSGFALSSEAGVNLPPRTVANLPAPGIFGRICATTNGRALIGSGSTVEAAGAGSGVAVMDMGSAWHILGTNISVQA